MKLKNQPTEPLKQTQHIVAFLDFLGASEKVKSEEESNIFLQNIGAIYNHAKIIAEKSKEKNQGIKIKIFSDNIVIAKEIDDRDNPELISEAYETVEQFSLMVYTSALITRSLMRGSITVGKFYMNDVFVFGDALIKAHEYESNIAIYPRLIVDKEIFIKAKINMWNSFTPPDSEKVIRRDGDGELYLSPFYGIPKIAENDKRKERILLNEIGEMVVEGYKEIFRKNKKTLSPKYHWLANQFNDYCHENNHPFLINLDKLVIEKKA